MVYTNILLHLLQLTCLHSSTRSILYSNISLDAACANCPNCRMLTN